MLENILSTCAYVEENSKHVTINHQNISKLVEILEIKSRKHWLSESPFGILDLETYEIVNLLLLYHSIGFSYWGEPKWTIETENGELDGAFAMLYILIKNSKTILDIDHLKKLTIEEFAHIVKGNIDIPLLKERYNNLVYVANVISREMNGDFYNYIKDIKEDTKLFNIIIEKFKIFNDVASYKGKPIYFYKLAQLLTSDILHVLEIKENAKVDYTNLKGCADYKIPQVLRNLGILIYDNELSKIIDSKQEIPSGSNYEVEIRANMIVAINKISEKYKGRVCPIEINDIIWLQGQNKANTKPYHLTRNVYY